MEPQSWVVTNEYYDRKPEKWRPKIEGQTCIMLIHHMDVNRKKLNLPDYWRKPGVKPVQQLEEYQVGSRMQLNGEPLVPKEPNMNILEDIQIKDRDTSEKPVFVWRKSLSDTNKKPIDHDRLQELTRVTSTLKTEHDQ